MSKQKNSLMTALLVAAVAVFVVAGGISIGSFFQASLLSQDQVNEIQNQSDNVKWKREDIMNKLRELKEFERMKIDVTQATTLLQPYEACVSGLEKLVGGNSGDFWSKNQECDDAQRDSQDYINEFLYPQRDCQGYRDTVKNRGRELKDMKRQIKDIKRNDSSADTSVLETQLTNLDNFLTQLGQTMANCSRNSIDTAQGIQDEINDGFSTFYEISQELNEKTNETRRIVEGKDDFEKNIKRNCAKDKARELKEIERNLQKAPNIAGGQEALTQMQELYNNLCVNLITKMQQAIDVNDIDTFGSLREDYWDGENNWNELRNETQEITNRTQQSKEIERVLKETKRSCKDPAREYKRAEKEGRVTEELKIIYQEISCDGHILTEMQNAATAMDLEGFWEQNQLLGENNQLFWDVMQQSNMIGDFSRRFKDLQRECDDRKRELKQISREMKDHDGNASSVDISALEEIVTTCNNLVQEASEAAKKGNFETIQTIDERMFEQVRGPWDETVQSFFALKEISFMKREIEKAEKDIEKGLKKVEKLLSKKQITQERADLCFALGDEGKTVIENINAALNEEDIEQARELMSEFENLGYQAETQCIVFAERGPVNFQEIIRENFTIDQSSSGDVLQGLLERVSEDLLNTVVERLTTQISSSVLENLLQKIGGNLNEQIQNHLAGLVENTEYLGDKAESVLQTKTDMLDLAEELEERASRNGGEELNSFLSELQTAIPVGKLAEELKILTNSFLENTQNASGIDLKKKVGEYINTAGKLLDRSVEAAWEEDFTPGKDLPLDAWYTKYAKTLKDEGIITGRKDAAGNPTGEFDPDSNVLTIEALKMVLELADIPKSELEGKPSDVICAQWAQGYCAYAEAEIPFLKERSRDWNVPATRSMVVRTLLEALNITDFLTPEESSWSDVRNTHPDYKYLETAKVLKVVTGNPDGTFDPNGLVKRGAMFKIMANGIRLKNSLEVPETF